MFKYHKINSVFKRRLDGSFNDQFSQPEFEYLFNNEWIGTEKIDGTNIRIHWNGEKVEIGGRTDNAQIPPFLLSYLQSMVTYFDFQTVFPEANDVMLFGEGFGNKIQKVGSQYLPDAVSFILFDVKIGDWWMTRETVTELAKQLNILYVPVLFEGTLPEAIEMVKKGFDSTIGTAKAEGLVLTPKVDLFSRNGNRIVTKLKTKDFS